MLPVSPEVKPNPMQNANFCSRLFVWWLNPLFKMGYKRKLEPNDMYSVLPEDRSQHLGEELQGYWDQEVKRAQKDTQEPSLTKAIVKCYWKSYLIWGMFTFLEEGTRVVQPIFLGKMISYVENSDSTDSVTLQEAYAYATVLSTCVLVWAVLHHLYFYHIQRVGMRLRVAMCHMIYRKALRLSSSALGKTTTGQIVNLLSNDVNRLDQVTMFLHYLWVGPLQAIIVTALLWMEVGMSCLAGMAILVVILLLQSCVWKLSSSLWSKTAALTDNRIQTISEIITGIRTIKMYAWEKSFIDLITSLRRKEIFKILRSSFFRGVNLALFFAVSKIMLFVTFVANDILDNLITASQVFVVVMLFEALRFTSTLYFPMAIEKVSEAVVSIQRIKNFLLLDEISQCYPQLPSDGEMTVDVQDFTAFWEKESGTPTLQDLSFTVRPGELLAVIGPVGTGKSSLLSAVLGELPPSQGKVSVHGRIAYVSQQPWVFSGTVRSNILFGKKYEKELYEEVIRACALEEDLQSFEDRDLTEIGDRGTTLSGGQKARINLARAVYQDADIYLLDDPLSAVDAEVSRHLFEQCICQTLSKKITILVTHQLQYLENATQILILKDGRMAQKGIYAEFPKPGIDFEDILLKTENEKAELPPGPGTPTLRKWSSSESSVPSLQSSSPSLEDAAPEDKDVTYALQDWWLADWANERSTIYAMVFGQGNMIVMPDPDWYLGTYSGLMVATGLFSITRSLLLIYVLVNSSQTLHNEMLESILKAPVLFFDRNPIGRILNRFSKDTGHMDDSLPLTFLDFIQMFLFMTGVAGVMVGVIPWIAIPVIPLSIIFFLLRIYFLWTYGDIKRLECTTRSPVFSHLASSLQGLWSIRVYKAEQRFQEVFDAHQDLHSESWFLLLTTFQWFAVRLDVICAVFFIVICFGSLMLAKTLNPGQFGLVLSLALTFTWIFQWCVRQSAEVEKMMVSAERVVEYMELEKEAPWEYEYRPPLDWPHEGELAFEDVNFRHTLDGPLVLKDLTECTEPKEKTGIVGRTGAGKSSLVAALFRLSEPRGGIWIDNISITSIGLHHLRKKMSVVPQEAVLFTGTMRKNLDPFDEYTNEDLWDALEEVRLKEIIESLPDKMDTELVESGSNLSVGQRQLLCLARGILRKNQILIIDNATSHVDPRTDELIQKNIREKFSQCTVLTITHRLSTVIDSEWIMVWDSGRLDDYDEPYTMLQERDGLFYKMVQQLGEAEATALTERAKQLYFSKNFPYITHGEHVIMNAYSGQPSALTIFESTP
ncbi:ATP-binding cassette sub-family C member 4-like isoform X3 [Dama dama]|uniref:ATP-binding cassette sub-family C member 4-like isoform X3 n=1 Tax=Dama dama TaxID=30532 RepID=UPI002A35F20F|nr:ATP-binding cassette sub-family C member 4-like isoform X3 [Dama dama]